MVTRGELVVAQLYPRDMNIYGDTGNVLALTRRAEAHGFTVLNIAMNQGDQMPQNVDIIVGGGGQDSGQSRVHEDLLERGALLNQFAKDGVPMLMICGMYQLFGHLFRTHTGEEMQGIGVLDVETFATKERLIGNVVTRSDEFGEIVGYENHSGHTFLGSGSVPLGEVVTGEGNNTTDSSEGARTANVIGSYLHGSLLPKNPALSDFLIGVAAQRKFGSFEPEVIHNEVIQRARESAKRRPR
jgi:CobQ-like glutamine amidotransferase family enzyme